MKKDFLVTTANDYLIVYMLLLRVEHRENEHFSPPIAFPLLFSVGQSIAVLWPHTNTRCDVILTDCPHNVSGKLVMYVFPPAWSWLSLVDYRIRFTAFSLASVHERFFWMAFHWMCYFKNFGEPSLPLQRRNRQSGANQRWFRHALQYDWLSALLHLHCGVIIMQTSY